MKIEGGYLISQIKHLNGRKLNQLLVSNNLTQFSGEQGKILYALYNQDQISVSQIALQTGLAINTLTIMLDKMEKNGLITRQCCQQDKRKKIVVLTDLGKQLKQHYDGISQKMMTIFYKGFSVDEINEFENYLRRIVSNLSSKEVQ